MFFFFKQKTAYEMRISDWSSDVCSSDLDRELEQSGSKCRYQCFRGAGHAAAGTRGQIEILTRTKPQSHKEISHPPFVLSLSKHRASFHREKEERPFDKLRANGAGDSLCGFLALRSEEHTSELQSLMRISYAVF